LIEDRLELLLITYNRADALRHTLDRLLDSPVAGCRLTVLDNHSTDRTPEVCAEFAQRFERMEVIRHPHNIGGNANYLRAAERPTAPYAWILADDDELDFSDFGDVEEALERGDVDLVSVGADGREDWPGGRTTMRRLIADGRPLWRVFTFIPNTIFRSELMDDRALFEGYDMIDTMYPQFAFVRLQVERDASVLVSRRMVVVRGGLTVPNSHLWWFTRAVRACSTITDRRLRTLAIYQASSTRLRWHVDLVASVMMERIVAPERVREELTELLFRLRGAQRLWVLLISPLALGPASLYAALRRRLGRGEADEGVFHDIEKQMS
jgi:glycosyltransferase involved in cell wall biosynthesis